MIVEVAAYLHCGLPWVLSLDVLTFNDLCSSMNRNKSTEIMLQSVNLRSSVWAQGDDLTKWYDLLKGKDPKARNDSDAFVSMWAKGQRR